MESEKVKEAVEEYFECEFELFIEFTGLIRYVALVVKSFMALELSFNQSFGREYILTCQEVLK